jgi:hypothetical protein
MPAESLIRKFHDLAGCDPETSLDADSLIGFFQMFRSNVTAIESSTGSLGKHKSICTSHVNTLDRLG